MPQKKVIIQNGNIAVAVRENSWELYFDCWLEIENFFKDKTIEVDCWGTTFKFNVNFSDAIAFLKNIEETEIGQRPEREKEGKHIYGNDIIFHFEWSDDLPAELTSEFLSFIICRFLQQVFLAGNICQPGAICMYLLKTDDIVDFTAPDLSSYFIDSSVDIIERDSWPRFSKVSFEQAWKWLDNQNSMFLDYAKTPSEKATFTVLKVGYDESLDEELILYIVRALEALFVDGNENCSRLLKERLHIVLSEPEKNKKWISKFYQTRSRIAHGDYEMARPSLYHYNDPALDDVYRSDIRKMMEKGVSVLIAVLQDLIHNNATEYKFDQTVQRV